MYSKQVPRGLGDRTTTNENEANFNHLDNKELDQALARGRRTLLKASTAVALSSIGLASRAQAAQVGATTIKLGQSAPITGPLAQVGLSVRETARAVFAEFNAKSGAVGKTIELVTLDDQNLQERTDVNVKLLISEHRAVALFGFVGAGAHRVGPRAAAAEHLPYVAPISGALELRSGAFPGVFNMRSSHADEIEAVVQHTRQIGLTRLSLIIEYNSQGWEVRDTMIAALGRTGNKLVSVASIDRQGSDFGLQGTIDAVLKAEPQAILLGADFSSSARFVAAARKARYGGTFYALSTVGGTPLSAALGPLAVGLSVTQVVPFPWTNSSKVSRDFQAFCGRNSIQPSFEGMEAYLSANLFAMAVKSAPLTDSAGLVAALERLPAVDFGGYVGSFYATNRRTPAQVELTVYSSNGRFIR